MAQDNSSSVVAQRYQKVRHPWFKGSIPQQNKGNSYQNANEFFHYATTNPKISMEPKKTSHTPTKKKKKKLW